MHVISRKAIREFCRERPEAEAALGQWYKVVCKARWTCFADVRRTFNSVDLYGRCHVFDVAATSIASSPRSTTTPDASTSDMSSPMPNTIGTAGRRNASRKRPQKPAGRHDRYARLTREFPLRPIRTEAELDAAADRAGRLALRDDLSRDEADYLEVLGDLIAKYESAHHPIPAGGSGVDSLRFLISENGLSIRGLADETGLSVSTLSEVLNGKRALTIRHMRALGRYFRVDPSLFLDPDESPA